MLPNPFGTQSLTETAAGIDGNLRVGVVVDVVVRRPQPVVLHVQISGRRGYVHRHVGSDAVGIDVVRSGRLEALGDLQVGAPEAAHARVHIPHAAGRPRGGEVVFDQDGTGLRALGADDEIRELDVSRLARAGADADDGLGIVHVCEEGPARHDDGVRLADDLGPRGYGDGRRHPVDAVVDVQDLAGRGGRVDGALERVRVVRAGVTPGSGGPGADER